MTTEERPTEVAPALLTIAAAAKRLALSERTIRNMIADGTLKPVRIRRAVRLRVDDVERIISADVQ